MQNLPKRKGLREYYAGTIRISVGLEHRNDILNDLLQALEGC
jgi:O-acetylhomoserine/O-acetylserine sulfhydrylase-like pyridoxal-dependent enzyme